MLSNKKRLQFWDSIVENTNFENGQEFLEIESHKLLMSDSGGKLYKYYSFDKNGYSLKSVKNNAMYCSLPKDFNDPFDCKLGYDLSSLIEAQDNIEIENIATVFNAFLMVYRYNVDVSSFDQSVQNIVSKWLSDKNFCEEFETISKKIVPKHPPISYTQKLTYFSIRIASDILAEEAFAKKLPATTRFLSEYQKHPFKKNELISNEPSKNKEVAELYGVEADQDEINLFLSILQKMQTENKESLLKTMENFKHFENTCIKMQNSFRVGCFSTVNKNRLMWSHYSNSHQGFCVEYDFSKRDSFSKIILLPVVYSKTRSKIPFKAVLQKDNILLSKQIFRALFTKDAAWKYENEWRLIVQADRDDSVKMPPISCIYLGANIKDDNKAIISEIAKANGIPLKQMVTDCGEFELHTKEL